MPECFRCKRSLPYTFTITFGEENPDAWHMENPAPDAAANYGSPVMVPICNKCSSMNLARCGSMEMARFEEKTTAD